MPQAVKITLILSILLLSENLIAQTVTNSKKLYQVKDSSGLGNDGPYIFYLQDFMLSKKIERVGEKYEIVTDTLYYNDRSIHVKRDHPTKKGFDVKLARFHKKAQTIVKSADSIFVISDIEGNFDALEKLLLSAGVVDENYRWTFGKGHLVVLGDVFDRGLEVTQCLWLIYKLEQEAPKGHVHFVIGNHEAINFLGFIDYVRNKYRLISYAFATDIKTLNSNRTVLGNWLRKKNMALKISDYLFVHGGISPFIIREKISLQKMNKYGRTNYDKTKLKGNKDLVFSAKGPMWYRGYFYDQKGKYKQITEAQLDSVLSFYDVKAVMVGHTIVPNIVPRFNKKLYPVDVSHRSNLQKGLPTQGLIIKGNQFYRLYTNGKRIRIN